MSKGVYEQSNRTESGGAKWNGVNTVILQLELGIYACELGTPSS